MVRSRVSVLLVVLYFVTLLYIFLWTKKIDHTLFKQQDQQLQQRHQQKQQQKPIQKHSTQQTIDHDSKKVTTTDTTPSTSFYKREIITLYFTNWLKYDDKGSSYDQITLIGLSLLTWWTFFWKIVLIWILQGSQHIQNKSAVFLLQQMNVVELVTFVFALMLTSSIPFPINPADFWQSLSSKLIIFFVGFILFQHTLFTTYLGLRLYLTYRRDGTIVVVFGYKTFFFVLMTLIHLAWICINLMDIEVKTGELSSIANEGIFITQKVITLMILAFMLKRRREVDDRNSIRQHTLWILFILNIIHIICTLKMLTYLTVNPTDIVFGLNSERQGKHCLLNMIARYC